MKAARGVLYQSIKLHVANQFDSVKV